MSELKLASTLILLKVEKMGTGPKGSTYVLWVKVVKISLPKSWEIPEYIINLNFGVSGLRYFLKKKDFQIT